MNSIRKRGLVMVSGGFDPLHLGHINLFTEAKAIGNELGVIINNDNYVRSKRNGGSVLMKQYDRAGIVGNLGCVDFTVINDDDNGDVSADLRYWCPEYFVVGPDYSDINNVPEAKTCQELGIQIVCLALLAKTHSSSVLLREAKVEQPKWYNPPVTVSLIATNITHNTLVCRRREGGQWQVPGGFLEANETLEGALHREVKEETTCKIAPNTIQYWESQVDRYKDGRQILTVHFCAGIIGEPAITDECYDYQWIDSDGLDRLGAGQFFSESDYMAVFKYLNVVKR